jgi:hypothetical protein
MDFIGLFRYLRSDGGKYIRICCQRGAAPGGTQAASAQADARLVHTGKWSDASLAAGDACAAWALRL